MLDAHVLVLNKSWVAVNVASARRALCLVFQGHAKIVHPADYSLHDFDGWCDLSRDPAFRAHYTRMIHTPNLEIPLPEVVILTLFNSFVRREVSFSRRNIFARDRHRCQYCGKRPAKQYLTLDHVFPRSRGGKDTWDNLVLACIECNVYKGNRTPEEAGMPLLAKPSAPLWLPRYGTRIPKHEITSWRRFVDTSYWSLNEEALSEAS